MRLITAAVSFAASLAAAVPTLPLEQQHPLSQGPNFDLIKEYEEGHPEPPARAKLKL